MLFDGEDLTRDGPESAPGRASSWPSSTRSRSPGVQNTYFLKAALNACASTAVRKSSTPMDFLALAREKMKLVEMDEKFS